MNKYFKRAEFSCKCGCGFEVADHELLELLSVVRVRFNAPVIINSACRCAKHNNAVGGASSSKHLLGIAADISVKGVSPSEVYGFIDSAYPDSYGIGKYDTFTHVDVRRYKARW